MEINVKMADNTIGYIWFQIQKQPKEYHRNTEIGAHVPWVIIGHLKRGAQKKFYKEFKMAEYWSLIKNSP